MSKYLEEAKRIRAIVEPHHNCAQSVAMAFADVLPLDREQIMGMAANFGAGMKVGLTCGAITGGLMVLGLCGVDDAETIEEYHELFQDKYNGCESCSELLEQNVGAFGIRKPFCDGLVFESVEAVEEILRSRGLI